MTTVVKFTLKDKNGCYAYYCNQSDDQSGEYVLFSDYRHDLANAQQELIAAQEEIRRLREALQNLVNFYDDPRIHITKEPQVMKDARKALND